MNGVFYIVLLFLRGLFCMFLYNYVNLRDIIVMFFYENYRRILIL